MIPEITKDSNARESFVVGREYLREKVLKILNDFSDKMYADAPIGEVSAFKLIKLYTSKFDEFNNILEQIKAL